MQSTSTTDHVGAKAEVALVIPVFRGWQHAGALLHKLGEKPDWLEIVIVDDASADRQSARFAAEHPAVRVVVREANGGFGAAVNTGLVSSSAETIIVTNSDLLVDADSLARLAALVKNNPDRILGPRTVIDGNSTVRVAHQFPTPWRDARELFAPFLLARHLRSSVEKWSSENGQIVDCDWVIGSCLAFARRTWIETGPIDEDFYMYSEEIDWQRRATDLGFRSGYVPGIAVRHDEMHGLPKADPARDERFRLIWRSRLRYHRKHGSWRAEFLLRSLWLLALPCSVPIYRFVGTVSKRHGDRARAELRRLRLLSRAAVSGGL